MSQQEVKQAVSNIIQDDNNIFKQFDNVIITGDFNYPNIKWNNNNVLSNKDEQFFNAVQDGYFIQHVDKPTRHRKDQESNILDLVLTQSDLDIESIEHCSPLGKSDHELLKIKTTILKLKAFDKESIKYNFDKGNFNAFKKYITDIDWLNKFGSLDAEEVCNIIVTKIEEGIELFIPLRKHSKSKKKPHLTGEVKKSVKKKYLLYKRWIESNNSHDYRNYIKERNLTSKLIKKAKRDHFGTI